MADYSHLKQLSPHQAPAKVGQLALLLANPNKGFCVEVVAHLPSNNAEVRYLDSEKGTFETSLTNLIPTGKTPADLLAFLRPDDSSLTSALEKERSAPDFEALAARQKAKSKTSKKPKTIAEAVAGLSQDQRDQLAKLLQSQLAKKGDD